MWDSKIAKRPDFITWDDSDKVREMLLACEGGKTEIPTTKSIEEWDCTAWFKATIYAKTFGNSNSKGTTLKKLYLEKINLAPRAFHTSVQSSTGNQDETYAMVIDQLRLLRNALCHSPKPEIARDVFDGWVQKVKDAFSAVNVHNKVVEVISEMSEKDFPTEKVQEVYESLTKELQAMCEFHQSTKQALTAIDERTLHTDQQVVLLEEKIDELHKIMKNLDIKRSVKAEVEEGVLVNKAGKIWGTVGDLLRRPLKQHHLIQGNTSPGDALLHEEEKRATWTIANFGYQTHVFQYKGCGKEKITAVVAYDHWKDDTGGSPKIISGGIGQNHVKVKVTSKWERGFHHTIYVYGRK